MASTLSSIEIHIHPEGSDRCDGSRPDTGRKAGPGAVATLGRAQALVRKARTANPARPVNVMLHGGRHEIPQPWMFGPRDGGSESAPVTWKAARGTRPVVSGGHKITGWKPDVINGVSCFTAPLLAGLNPLQLFVDGHRARRARLPKKGYFRVKSTFGKRYLNETLWGEGPDEAEYHEGDLRKFRNLEDVRFVVMGAWYEMWMRIVALDEKRRSVKLHMDAWQRLVDETGNSSRYFVENAGEALTEPGEWYFDRAARKIHYIPLAGQSADEIEAIVSQVDLLLDVCGGRKNPVSHLRFENISFEHCDWHPPQDFRGSIQAGHLLPGALLFRDAEHCVVYGCEISKVAQFGVMLGKGSHDCRVVACTLHDLGGGGVHVDHEWLQPHSKEVGPVLLRPIKDLRPRAATISDNSIHGGGKIYPGAVGILVGNAAFNRILHNEVSDFHYSGISVGWTWGSAPTACVDNRIEGNHVHHLNMEPTFSDLGLIYTLGAQPGSTIRGNHLHHVSSYGYGGEGIYNDEGSSGFLIENNLAHHCRHAGYSGAPRDVVVRNNIFAWCLETQVSPAVQGTEFFGTIFENNVVTWNEGTFGNAAPYGLFPEGTRLRGNVLWAAGLPLRLTDGRSIAYWQEQGQMPDTLVADPLFVDPDGGDFRLRDGSPVVAHGFKPFDSSLAGPRGGVIRPESYASWLKKFPMPSDKPILFFRTDQPDARTLRLRIINVGRLPAGGRVCWDVPKGVEVKGTILRDLPRLQPGEVREFTFDVSGPEGMHLIGVWPRAGSENPAFCPFEVCSQQLVLTEIKGGAVLAQLERSLAGVSPLVLRLGGREMGTVRLGRQGAHMLVSAHIHDANIRRVEKNFWEGSCFELFLSPGFRGTVVQVVFVPDLEAGKMRVHRQHAFTPVPLPDVPHLFSRTEGGYALQAILPLELFGICAETKIGRIEISAGVHPKPDSAMSKKAAAYCTQEPNRITRGMAVLRLQG